MKKNKVAKVFSIIILIVTIMTIGSTNIYATSGIFSGADDFIKDGDGGTGSTINTGAMQSTIDIIYNTLLIIGIVVAVLVGIILGIQFVTGSVEQKGKVKESIIPYIAGCIVIFGAFGIWRLVIIILR